MKRVARIEPTRIPGTNLWVYNSEGARFEGEPVDDVAQKERHAAGAPPDLVGGASIDPAGGPGGGPCVVFGVR